MDLSLILEILKILGWIYLSGLIITFSIYFSFLMESWNESCISDTKSPEQVVASETDLLLESVTPLLAAIIWPLILLVLILWGLDKLRNLLKKPEPLNGNSY